MKMFCYQCEETINNKGCTIEGVCGKNDTVANLQDSLVYLLKEISVHAVKARGLGLSDEKVDYFICEALFSTLTNVNFDPERISGLIERASAILDGFRQNYKRELPADKQVGVLSEQNEGLRSLKEMIIYALKGIAAYAYHAYVLGYKDNDIFAFLEEALAATLDKTKTTDDFLSLAMQAGSMGVKVLALLDKANTAKYGSPEITKVYTGTKEGPAILVSGHDLRDLEEILEQTKETGINVYTHGEMLPAHAYPAFKKYKHLTANYGGAWHSQQKDFDAFNGAIVMTTNCLQLPKESYKDRIFTTGTVGWPEVTHIPERENNQPKDFSKVIEKALVLGGLEEKEGKYLTIGFAHQAVLANAGKVIELVKSGKIKRFVVMAGCDGRYKEREYFTEVAKKLPQEAVILTCGCAKYRYNMLDLGDIEGLPRVLDAGQCNDSYSLVVIALKLAEAFGLKDVNQLPLSFDLGWYEQKAVLVLLALLSLGVKNIRLGPRLPAFVSPGVLKVLVEKFGVKPITNPDNDVREIMQLEKIHA